MARSLILLALPLAGCVFGEPEGLKPRVYGDVVSFLVESAGAPGVLELLAPEPMVEYPAGPFAPVLRVRGDVATGADGTSYAVLSGVRQAVPFESYFAVTPAGEPIALGDVAPMGVPADILSVQGLAVAGGVLFSVCDVTGHGFLRVARASDRTIATLGEGPCRVAYGAAIDPQVFLKAELDLSGRALTITRQRVVGDAVQLDGTFTASASASPSAQPIFVEEVSAGVYELVYAGPGFGYTWARSDGASRLIEGVTLEPGALWRLPSGALRVVRGGFEGERLADWHVESDGALREVAPALPAPMDGFWTRAGPRGEASAVKSKVVREAVGNLPAILLDEELRWRSVRDDAFVVETPPLSPCVSQQDCFEIGTVAFHAMLGPEGKRFALYSLWSWYGPTGLYARPL